MARVIIIAEGQTEETFVNKVLAQELGERNVFIEASKLQNRGGSRNFQKLTKTAKEFLESDSNLYVSTMIDLYKLPTDFPGSQEAQNQQNCYGKVEFLEEKLSEEINNLRFIPYIQLHEFEALLFSNVHSIHNNLPDSNDGNLLQLQNIVKQFNSPEEINEGEATAPSKRLISIYPSYDKVRLGSIIPEKLGLDQIRNKCSHFDKWIKKLEALSI